MYYYVQISMVKNSDDGSFISQYVDKKKASWVMYHKNTSLN